MAPDHRSPSPSADQGRLTPSHTDAVDVTEVEEAVGVVQEDTSAHGVEADTAVEDISEHPITDFVNAPDLSAAREILIRSQGDFDEATVA